MQAWNRSSLFLKRGAGPSQPIPILSKPPPPRTAPSAFGSPTRNRARRRPHNDRNDEKRRRITNKSYKTERSYFGGLELIYSVSCMLLVPQLRTGLYSLAFSYPHHRVTRNPQLTPRPRTVNVHFRQLYRYLELTPFLPFLPLRSFAHSDKRWTPSATIIDFTFPFPIPFHLQSLRGFLRHFAVFVHGTDSDQPRFRGFYRIAGGRSWLR